MALPCTLVDVDNNTSVPEEPRFGQSNSSLTRGRVFQKVQDTGRLIELAEDALVKETEGDKAMRVRISAVTDDQIKTAEHVVVVADDEPKWDEQLAGRYVVAPLVPIVESHGATVLEIIVDRSDADALERLGERVRLLKGLDPHV